ncbi:unnamed protein product [Prorocentrum cordatum]|uniref:Phosphoglycerate mutase (2,3-diphosphoglycerate-dependent) n=1 Tax=Prorocentrum cordatum TaxID=2364126 RepID=A0ABN9UPS2_9DINO|nr:unnamed protein product [Polarella glacialis]
MAGAGPKSVVLIRHGQSAAQLYSRSQRWDHTLTELRDPYLSEEGAAQAADLGRWRRGTLVFFVGGHGPWAVFSLRSARGGAAPGPAPCQLDAPRPYPSVRHHLARGVDLEAPLRF